MEVTIVQALLIGLIYYLGANGTPWLTVNMSWALRRPLISGIMVGLILGDPVKGCIVGAAINVTYLAQITAGGAQTMDEGLAGTVGTALAIISNTSAGVAVTLAVPISLLGNLLWMVYMTGDIFIVHRMDKVAASGDIKKIIFYNIVPSQIFHLHNSSSNRCVQWIWCSDKYVKCITGNTSDRCIKYDRNNPASTWNCDEF